MFRFEDAGYGYDRFGMSPKWIEAGKLPFELLYKHWFRVSSYDAHHVPSEGRGILASNHSGTLPFDGVMIYLDVMHQSHPQRVPRVIMDHFVPKLPFVGMFFSRMGVIGGSRGNVRHLLESEELLLVFPEGVPGISKPSSERYQLQEWRVGHVELAIRHSAPVIPVAVIGAEEQLPTLAKLPVKLFGAPFLPIPLTPFPLPVHYHIYYGEPISFACTPEQADDPDIVQEAAERVKASVEALIARGLRERKGVFR